MSFENLGRFAESQSSADTNESAHLRLVNNWLDTHHERQPDPPPVSPPIPEKTWPTERETMAGVFAHVINVTKDPNLPERVNVWDSLDKLFVDRLKQAGGNAAPVENWANEELSKAGSPYRMKFGEMYHRNQGWDTRLVHITDKDGNELKHPALWVEYYNPQWR
ncbi:MAG TPA: hypothetical protein V6D22_17695 [Candidatus Obscuribacterales bacterium]